MDTRTLPGPTTALPPQHTTFIGREAELTDITALLTDPHCRLLTLVGPGGCGKTRLAIEALRLLEVVDGAHFVPLQPLQSADQVIGAIINTLSFRPDDNADPETALLTDLQDKRLLLVLDNFEHLMDAATLVAAILNAAPMVTLLVTSREPLNLREEWVREVGGLAYPHNGAVSSMADYSALALFADRAHRLRNDFSLDDEYAHVVRICQLVGGLPLTLELAAGWLRTLSPAAIAEEIEHNVDILAATTRNLPDRHRSMRAVFDHSWQLLTDQERAVLPRFSVFRGGCTREAAEEVTGATLPILASLVEKSLLRHDPATDRYDMQELLRQYMWEQLDETGEADRIRDVHAHYFAASFNIQICFAQNMDKTVFLNHLHTELDNIRASWNWALARENYKIIDQLVDALWTYYTDHNRSFEMGALCQAAVDQLAACTGKQERAILGRVLARLGKWEASYLKRGGASSLIDRAEASFRQSMAIAREQNDLQEYYYAARWLGWNVLGRHRATYAEAQQILEECVAYFRTQGESDSLAMGLINLAEICGKLGQVNQQKALLDESYQINRARNHRQGIAEVSTYLGINATNQGRWDEARQRLVQLIDGILSDATVLRFSAYHYYLATAYMNLMVISIMQGDFEEAKQLDQALLERRELTKYLHVEDFRTSIDYSLHKNLLGAVTSEPIEALHLAEKAIACAEQHVGFPELVERGRVIRAWVLCDLAQFDEASREIAEVLSSMLRYYRISVNLMLAIATAARILAHQGNHSRAAELLGLVFTCPNSPQGYLERHHGITQLRADLKAKLGAEAYAAAWKRGAQLDVEQVARDLLHEFSDDDQIAQANASLPNPLTERELEVLALLADGLTNPQIAERLFITTGTVKGHVNKVLHKLDATDRQQAGARARELHLIGHITAKESIANPR